MLAAQYFDAMCVDSFTQGLPLSNFVPPPPSPAPSDYPTDEDPAHLWNATTYSPPSVPGKKSSSGNKLYVHSGGLGVPFPPLCDPATSYTFFII